ncbi:MAG: hypothetical protein JXM70_04375 [Pirellulales bacterium]|nr:hypothetical protein [Pirellulales bacterium]
MSPSAKLTSIDAVEKMSIAITKFGEEVTAALDQLDLESKRAMEWIRHERKMYWETQVRRNRDGVSEARSELERALTYRGVAGQRPACREERAELEKMKRRLHVSEGKVESVRHWTNAIDHQVLELIGSVSQLAQWLQADLPRAQGVLKRLTATLESYVATPATTDDAPTRKLAVGGKTSRIERGTQEQEEDREQRAEDSEKEETSDEGM